MVNWIHEIEPKTLKIAIENYFKNNLKEQGVIICDTVMAKDQNYTYHHDINMLIGNIPCEVTIIGKDINQRTVYSIKKNIVSSYCLTSSEAITDHCEN